MTRILEKREDLVEAQFFIFGVVTFNYFRKMLYPTEHNES